MNLGFRLLSLCVVISLVYQDFGRTGMVIINEMNRVMKVKKLMPWFGFNSPEKHLSVPFCC